MSFDARALAILQRRAESAAAASTAASRAVRAQVAMVAVGGEQLGIPAQSLLRVLNAPTVVPLPGLPPYLAGVVNVRGEIVCVVDLGLWLGLATPSKRRCLAVVRGPDGLLGLLADACLGFRDVFADEVAETLLAADGAATRPVSFVTKDLLAVLDLSRLWKDERLMVDTAAGGASC